MQVPDAGDDRLVCLAVAHDAEGRVLFGQAAEVGLQQRGPEQQLGHEIAVRHRVQAVFANRWEAQFGSQEVAVNGQRIAGQSARAQRQHGDALFQIFQPLPISLQHPEVAHQPVAEEHRLRSLQVRVAGHDDVQMLLCPVEDRLLQLD